MTSDPKTAQIFIRADPKILTKIRRALPDVSIQAIVTELLFHLAETFHDEKFDIAVFYKEAAERAKESLKTIADPEGEES